MAARPKLRLALVLFASFGLSGCLSTEYLIEKPPETPKLTNTREGLIDLPYPPQPVPIAVYAFADQTGQFKPVENIQTLSRALSQGAGSILVQALRDAGHGRWFSVLEREHVDNLLKERQIITDTRARYLGETRINPEALPAMLFAGVLLEGGIIGYDSDVRTGGLGAHYLGVGANTSYRQDTISVYLRAVAVKTGEVLASVVTRKTIDSIELDSGAFRYVAYKDLLELEAGFSVNEPTLIAVEQAIQKAVYDLVLDGANQGIWSFYDRAQAQPLIDSFLAERGYATALPAAANAAQQPAANRQSSANPPRQPAVAAPAPRPVSAAAPITPAHVIERDGKPVANASEGGAYLQIGSYATEDAARKAWATFVQRYGDVVGRRSPEITTATIRGAVAYRLRLGPYATRYAAVTACDSLKTLGRDCLVVVSNYSPQREAASAATPAAPASQLSRIPGNGLPHTSAQPTSGDLHENGSPQPPAGGQMVPASGG